MPGSIRLFIDEDVHLELADALRTRGFDAIHVREVGRRSLSDREQLAYAIDQRRSLLTFNVGDFCRLHSEFMSTDREHFGILVSAQRSIGATLGSVLRYVQTHTADELHDQIIFL
jgi:hypothetical protein